MKKALRIALKWYKYAAIIFITGYVIYIVIDDFGLFKYVETVSDFGEFFWGELMFLVAYLIAFSLYYWLVAFTISFIYSKFNKTKTYADQK
jgi:hypothetical protein